MKTVCMILMMGFWFVPTTKAQLFNEIFRQKATQRKYLAQQIAFLQLHLGALKQGYAIARDGIGLVHNIKNGEFSLHSAFFSSLSTVHPAIRGSAVARQAAKAIDECVTLSSRMRQQWPVHPILLPEERSMLRVSAEADMEFAGDLAATLSTLVTSGKLELSAADRLRRLEEVEQQAMNFRARLLAVDRKNGLLVAQRQRELVELAHLRQLYKADK